MDRATGLSWRQLACFGVIILAASGCGSVPRGQMDDCRQQSLALQAELAQTKDLAAKLRTQNRDMAARSVEDARRLATLEETNERLERSVTAYQAERDQYAAALAQIKSQVYAATASSGRSEPR